MEQQKKQVEADEDQGAPEWMVTFSDCMTLLLTFFVLLLSFSSFDNRVFRRLRVIYSTGLTTITPIRRSDRDAFMSIPPIEYVTDLDKGSEKPTLVMGNEEGLIEEKGSFNSNRGIIFALPSNKLFWGNGIAISTAGRQIMDNIALFLSEMPHRIVISENGPSQEQSQESLGLQRAWTVMNYLTVKQNLDKDRFSISSVSTLSQNSTTSPDSSPHKTQNERTVEIVLLARNLYN